MKKNVQDVEDDGVDGKAEGRGVAPPLRGRPTQQPALTARQADHFLSGVALLGLEHSFGHLREQGT